MNEIRSFRGDHYFLSNYSPTQFYVEGVGIAESGEHAYNALKTNSLAGRREILAASSPGEAKNISFSYPLRSDWTSGGRVRAMQDVLAAKFSVPQLAELLLRSGESFLIEGNTHHDNFWGDCECKRPECADAGMNMLGELLMAARSGLVEDQATESKPERRDVQDWEDMTEWLADQLIDQPVGLEISLGPKDVRVLVEKEVIVLDLDDVMDNDEDDDDEPELLVTPAVSAQVYVLNDGVFLVRRSRCVLNTIRFVDHEAVDIQLGTWYIDNPFGDCTDGYIYVKDPSLVAEMVISWFRDNADAPAFDQIGLHYEYAEHLPTGDDQGTYGAY